MPPKSSSRSQRPENMAPLLAFLLTLQRHRYATLGAGLLLAVSLGYGYFSGPTAPSTGSEDEEFVDLGDFDGETPALALKPIPPAPLSVESQRTDDGSAWDLDASGVQSANLTIPPSVNAPPPPVAGDSPAWLVGTIEADDGPVAEAPQSIERLGFGGPLLLPR
jgi:hypothetical protein